MALWRLTARARGCSPGLVVLAQAVPEVSAMLVLDMLRLTEDEKWLFGALAAMTLAAFVLARLALP